jgi:hypothetical protein
MDENEGKKKTDWKKILTVLVAVGGAVVAALGSENK